MTIEARNIKREQAITSLHRIAHYSQMMKEADWPEERSFFEYLLGRETAKVQNIARELSCE